jgi:hypothetical protein
VFLKGNGQTPLFEIPATVEALPQGIFCGNVYIRQLYLGSDIQLEELPKGFCSESALDFIRIPRSVKLIGAKAFYCCGSLAVEFEENSQLAEIGPKAFAFCPLASFLVPQEVKFIGVEAFAEVPCPIVFARGLVFLEQSSGDSRVVQAGEPVSAAFSNNGSTTVTPIDEPPEPDSAVAAAFFEPLFQ